MTRFLRKRLPRDEAGVTIVEVTLTMLILAIVLTVAFDFLDRATVIATRTDAQAQAEGDTQQALRTVTQHLRGAFPIVGTCNTVGYPTTYENCVRFEVPRAVSAQGSCANKTVFVIGLVADPTPKVVGEKLLVYDRQEHTGTTTCTTATNLSKRVLLRRVANATTQPLFTYYGSDGNAAAAVPAAATVKVTLHVRYRTGSDAIVMSSSAALRNNITR